MIWCQHGPCLPVMGAYFKPSSMRLQTDNDCPWTSDASGSSEPTTGGAGTSGISEDRVVSAHGCSSPWESCTSTESWACTSHRISVCMTSSKWSSGFSDWPRRYTTNCPKIFISERPKSICAFKVRMASREINNGAAPCTRAALMKPFLPASTTGMDTTWCDVSRDPLPKRKWFTSASGWGRSKPCCSHKCWNSRKVFEPMIVFPHPESKTP